MHSAPKRRKWPRRTAKWAATVVILFAAPAWYVTERRALIRLWPTSDGGESGLWLIRGRVGYTHTKFRQADGPKTQWGPTSPAGWTWGFSLRRNTPTASIVVYAPLWPVWLVLVPVATRLWYLDWKDHRFGPGQCGHCGYALAGLDGN